MSISRGAPHSHGGESVSHELTSALVRELVPRIRDAASRAELDRIEESIAQQYAATPAQRLANGPALEELSDAAKVRRSQLA